MNFLSLVDVAGKAAPASTANGEGINEVVQDGKAEAPSDVFATLFTKDGTVEPSLLGTKGVARLTAEGAVSFDDMATTTNVAKNTNPLSASSIEPASYQTSVASLPSKSQNASLKPELKLSLPVRKPQSLPGVLEADVRPKITPNLPSDPDSPDAARLVPVQPIVTSEQPQAGQQKISRVVGPVSTGGGGLEAVANIEAPTKQVDGQTHVSHNSPAEMPPQTKRTSPVRSELASPTATDMPTAIKSDEQAQKPQSPSTSGNQQTTTVSSRDPLVPSVARALPQAMINEAIRSDAPIAQPASGLAEDNVSVASAPKNPAAVSVRDASQSPILVPETAIRTSASTKVLEAGETLASKVLVDGKTQLPGNPVAKEQVLKSSSGAVTADQSRKSVHPTSQHRVSEDSPEFANGGAAPKSTKADISAPHESVVKSRDSETQLPRQGLPASQSDTLPLQRFPIGSAPSEATTSTLQMFELKTQDAEPKSQTSHMLLAESADSERLPASESTRPILQNPSANRADIARSVASQMMAAVGQSSDGTIDVRLSPEDLGRVRVALAPAELGITVTITAERPETLELVRRHIDLFAQDLRQNGFQNLAFNFGQSGQDDRPTLRLPEQVTPNFEEASSFEPTTPIRSKTPDGRLDIRL